jgi:hypothetical protein
MPDNKMGGFPATNSWASKESNKSIHNGGDFYWKIVVVLVKQLLFILSFINR